jgi:hypothetical protein
VKRFLLLWFVLASASIVASLVIHTFTTGSFRVRSDVVITLLCVTIVQTAVLQLLTRFSRSKPHESPDQHR